jgi:hypothetical protein
VLKLFHAEEREATMELQDAVMTRLREVRVSAPFAVPSREGRSWVRERGHLGRLLEWVQGEDWCRMDLPRKMAAMGQVGEVRGIVVVITVISASLLFLFVLTLSAQRANRRGAARGADGGRSGAATLCVAHQRRAFCALSSPQRRSPPESRTRSDIRSIVERV